MKNFIVRLMSFSLLILCLQAGEVFAGKRVQPGGFDQALIALAEAELEPTSNLPAMMALDPNLESLKKTLNWDDFQVEVFADEAEEFFRDRWGFDFTNIDEDENGIKVMPGVGMLMPVKFVPEFGYRISHMSGKRVNRRLDTFGLVIGIFGENLRYHGEYGGEEGVPAFPGELLSFGVYHVAKEKINPKRKKAKGKKKRKGKKHKKKNKKSPVGDLIFFKQNAPGRFSENGHIGIFCELESEKWGTGLGEGVAGLIPLENGKLRAYSRVFMAFPGRVFEGPVDNQDGDIISNF